MLDRREKPREFFLSGWDPYVISLTAEARAAREEAAQPASEELLPEVTSESVADSRESHKPTVTRWRAMLLNRLR